MSSTDPAGRRILPITIVSRIIFETFKRVYEERFERAYGFYRPYLRSVIYRYLDCGVLRNGFARVRCGECGHEYLLAFSCKRRHFCPSCHQICLQHPQNLSTLFPLRPLTAFGTESLCLGGLEGLFPRDGSVRECGAWSGHCHPDVWRFVGVQPVLPCSLHRGLF